MIRFRSIELSNIKNVRRGKIEFKDTVYGSSVMGVYGQNGSGKTAVVDSLGCIQNIIRGLPLDRESIDLIGSAANHAEISVEIEVTRGSDRSLGFEEHIGSTVAGGQPFTVGYSFSFCELDGKPHLSSERFSIRSKHITKRTLISYNENSVDRGQNLKPDHRWRALKNLAGKDADLDLMVAQRSLDLQSSSKLFSKPMVSFALAARNAYLDKLKSSTLSDSAKTAFETVLVPFMDAATLLSAFAAEKLRVCGTRRSAALAFDIFSLAAPDPEHGGWSSAESEKGVLPYDVSLSIDQTAVLPSEVCDSVKSTIGTINRVLKAIVPGLSIQVNVLHDETLDDGTAGKRVEFLSCRGGIRVPFRTESEGIKKIASMLGWLINVYSDDSACLVVDEMDSGVFEFLLGELLQVVTEHGKGQLIFTAHNLRALECLPVGCLTFTTVNPENRYIKFRGTSASNNLRNQYLRAINLGGQKEQVYEPTSTVAIDSAFLEAGAPQPLDFDSLLASIVGEC